MGTRGYGYSQIYVRVQIIMGSQIPVYYIRGYLFSYPPRTRDGFYPRVPVGIGISATPTYIYTLTPAFYLNCLHYPSI